MLSNSTVSYAYIAMMSIFLRSDALFIDWQVLSIRFVETPLSFCCIKWSNVGSIMPTEHAIGRQSPKLTAIPLFDLCLKQCLSSQWMKRSEEKRNRTQSFCIGSITFFFWFQIWYAFVLIVTMAIDILSWLWHRRQFPKWCTKNFHWWNSLSVQEWLARGSIEFHNAFHLVLYRNIAEIRPIHINFQKKSPMGICPKSLELNSSTKAYEVISKKENKAYNQIWTYVSVTKLVNVANSVWLLEFHWNTRRSSLSRNSCAFEEKFHSWIVQNLAMLNLVDVNKDLQRSNECNKRDTQKITDLQRNL